MGVRELILWAALAPLAAGCNRAGDPGSGTPAGDKAPAPDTEKGRPGQPKRPNPADIGEVTEYLDQARVGRVRLALFDIHLAAEKYLTAEGDWPASLQALTQKSPGGGGPFLKPEELLDPWGRPFQFKIEEDAERVLFVAWSQGPDPSNSKGYIYRDVRKP